MSGKVRAIDTGDKDKMRAELELMKRSLPVFLEYAVISAQIKKTSFDALIKQGFTEPQALELCKKGLEI